MRILNLTRTVEQRLLRARSGRDVRAEKVAARIVADVRKRGDAALFAWTKKLDGVDLKQEGLWIPQCEVDCARESATERFIQAANHACKNIRRVAQQQLSCEWNIEVEPGVHISQMVRPIQAIGCYIPGGHASLVSTMLMTVVPAQVAGVKRIIVVCPRPNPYLLAAASLLGVTEILRIGGAQAIAALAYGTRSVPRVEKIFGPGNRFVTAAKQLVSSDCAMDLPAGPTEAVVLAEDGNPEWIAADLLAQAEHAQDAGSFLVTTSRQLAEAVRKSVAAQLAKLPRSNPARVSIQCSGAILLASSLRHACDIVNRFAPEHLSLPQGDDGLLDRITASGTVFVGPYAAQALGDYASGSNHVLPTGGWARRRGGLSTADFVKCITVQRINREGWQGLKEDVRTLAHAETLPAHAHAVEVRQ